MKTEHELKCNTEYFARVQSGQKTFEIRKNDRDYQVGDILVLQEFLSDKGEYPDWGSSLRAEIIYMTSFAQKEGYVVLGLNLLKDKMDFAREAMGYPNVK